MSYLVIPNLLEAPVIPIHPFPFALDSFQGHAMAAIAQDENVLICAKTGSGKTLVGEYQIYHSLSKGKRVFYTTPIKSLSNQKFYDLKHQFTEASVGIMTGDLKFCPTAQIIVMTTEILRNLLYKRGTTTEHLGLTASISLDDVDAVIFDECHYLNDPDRGNIWEETMILLPRDINMVMLSATLDHPEYLAEWLGDMKQKRIHLIETLYRIVPLTHGVLQRNRITEQYEFVTIMDATEHYQDVTYKDWHMHQKEGMAEKRRYQEKVTTLRAAGVKGVIEGKGKGDNHFIHQLNEVIPFLQRENLLPALFFVLSRKGCESYAAKVEHTLLTSSEIAAVKHIISFHLYRYKELETMSQYHQIYALLCRGIAFHHSGLLPLLKEIVEILFSKGYVKMLFCTETFAVGLNMPTKTVLFAGVKKYDEHLNAMRNLRNDEYLQMAGRAGRRGKDDRGMVIYFPDREPIVPQEIFQMLKGSKPALCSRMTFHYEFVLKTLQSSMRWLDLMKQSYWFRMIQEEIKDGEKEYDRLCREKEKTEVEEPYRTGCTERSEAEHRMRTSGKKEAQRQLDGIKNKQMGPKWASAWTRYQQGLMLQKRIDTHKIELDAQLDYTKDMEYVVQFLYEMKYVTHNDPYTLQSEHLTRKGILATEVNEGHPLLMTELYDSQILHSLSGIEIVMVLACFLEGSPTASISSTISLTVQMAIGQMKQWIESYRIKEELSGYPIRGYWDISTGMIEPISRWIQGEELSLLCQEYELFEGNMIRSLAKMSHLIEEWIAMATYCRHTDQVEKMMEIHSQIIRGFMTPDSLYLRLSKI